MVILDESKNLDADVPYMLEVYNKFLKTGVCPGKGFCKHKKI